MDHHIIASAFTRYPSQRNYGPLGLNSINCYNIIISRGGIDRAYPMAEKEANLQITRFEETSTRYSLVLN